MITRVSGMHYPISIIHVIWNTFSIQKLLYFVFRTYVGSDDVNIARGCRVLMCTRFDSEYIHPETDAMSICRDESCLLPPVDV